MQTIFALAVSGMGQAGGRADTQGPNPLVISAKYEGEEEVKAERATRKVTGESVS